MIQFELGVVLTVVGGRGCGGDITTVVATDRAAKTTLPSIICSNLQQAETTHYSEFEKEQIVFE